MLFAFSPILVPTAIIGLCFAYFFILMIISAFQNGFAAGCAALAALIGTPTLILLWLRAVGRVALGWGRAPEPETFVLHPTVEERYAAGDFIHRDYEQDKREWEAYRREQGW